MRDEKRGTNITTPITGSTEHVIGFSFVDYTDLTNIGDDKDEEVLSEQTQGSLDTWKGILNATCGSLNVEKSFW